MKKDIYIVLIKAHTGLGNIARKITGYEYTHIAVSLDHSLTEFKTFSRRKHYLPFDAGFMTEYRDFYAFGKHKNVKIKVFKLTIEDERFEAIEKFIDECERDGEYIFNLFSMITMPVFHGFQVYKAHNCMSFTAKIIELTEKVPLDRPYYKYSIKDLDQLLDSYKIFEGYLERKKSEGYQEYMKKPNTLEKITTSTKLILTLVKRLI
jgi:hypothetical protein